MHTEKFAVKLTIFVAPASPPDNVTVMASIIPTEIMVTWDIVPEMYQNGVITMYEVLYVPLETFDGAIGPLSVNVTEQMTNLTDLQEYVNYTISVRAYTSVGAGPYSSETIVRTQEDSEFIARLAYKIVTAFLLPSSSQSSRQCDCNGYFSH